MLVRLTSGLLTLSTAERLVDGMVAAVLSLIFQAHIVDRYASANSVCGRAVKTGVGNDIAVSGDSSMSVDTLDHRTTSIVVMKS